jgi:hypothetical protein
VNNLEKEFVPYELALRMKALGYNKPCFGYWSTKYISSFEILEPKLFISENIEESALIRRREISCQAFTYSQAFRWFREKYGLLVNIEKGTNPENYFPVIGNVSHRYNPNLWFDTYEEAELACLGKLVENAESKIEL